MLAAMALGADGVQIGSRFVATQESSANELFKRRVINSKEGETKLMLKQLTPVRLLKNKFSEELEIAETNGASIEELTQLLGKGRAKKGMFEGNLDDGELEIGQIAAVIQKIQPVTEIMNEIITEFVAAKAELLKINF
jgi:enoyl-[acyl-carrier protein] reductase II